MQHNAQQALSSGLNPSLPQKRPSWEGHKRPDVRVPRFIAELCTCHASTLMCISRTGMPNFFCDENCAANFLSSEEADRIFLETQDLDSVLRRILTPADLRTYWAALAEVLIHQPGGLQCRLGRALPVLI